MVARLAHLPYRSRLRTNRGTAGAPGRAHPPRVGRRGLGVCARHPRSIGLEIRSAWLPRARPRGARRRNAMAASSAHRPLIVGTAGHIDHGKTALIRLLTGVDTDRLKQEKERGISIELGFTSLQLPSGEQLGVVDVPGHERFVRNMLAGAGGIDLILFIVAADEGVMPQTREHMDIIDLLGVERGVVALTKTDLVEEEFLELVEETVGEYLAETCLRTAPIVRVSAQTGEGKADVLQALEQVAAEVQLGERGSLVRLPIDRVFTMEGFGTVVTGTLWAGRLREGETVRILPRDLTTRVKSLEVHGRRVGEALAGQRVAVALHAVEKSTIERGDWLLGGGSQRSATTFVDAQVRLLASAAAPIRSGQRMRFHLGAAELLGRLILLDADRLEPGKRGWAQLRLETPTLTERGDHFVLRTYSPMHTVAGGTVVTAGVGRRRRYRREDLAALDQAAAGTPRERVAAVVERYGARGCERAPLARESGSSGPEVEEALRELSETGLVVPVGRRRVVSRAGLTAAGERIRGILEAYQARAPLSWGLAKSELKKRVEGEIGADVVEAWVRSAAEAGRLFVRNDRLRVGSDRLVLNAAHEALRDAILDAVRQAGFAGQRQRELLAQVAARGHGPGSAAQREAEALLLLLVDSGEIVRIPPDFYFATSRVDEAIARLRDYFTSHAELTVGDLKDLLGVTRKQAVPLLEYLDQQRWTVRRGDARRRGPRLRADAEESPS
ncbi:MAG: selenocysteine-specific translation elongation factor [Candidatus Eisenbacteria bacterium]|nr:selenocysteine-specific translation elongation factor [Candidatus Eisenbacteria bacterium]